jgi:tetratricopeptide (TPR) repeat protein
VDAHGHLLLTTYQATLELFALREAGESVPAGLRTQMAQRAVRDYGEFLQAYPKEWSVVIEYIEWVHALSGPGAALEAVDRLRRDGEPSFSYFPAWFHAELGNRQRARELAEQFTQAIDDPTSPQPHYLHAFLALQEGQYDEARRAISRALELEPRHLLADRLRREIEEAAGEEKE